MCVSVNCCVHVVVSLCCFGVSSKTDEHSESEDTTDADNRLLVYMCECAACVEEDTGGRRVGPMIWVQHARKVAEPNAEVRIW